MKFRQYLGPWLLCILLLVCCYATTAQSTSDRSQYYPAFSWETVPVAFHFGKKGALMTKEEAQFVASKSNFICLEKAHANEQFEYTEDAIEAEAKQLKKYNPDMKVIFYWNTFLDYSMFRAHNEYQKHPEWWLKTKSGDLDLKKGSLKRYDLANAQVRNWWTEVAKMAVVDGSTDGVFMDAFPQIKATANRQLWGDKKFEEVQQGLRDIIEETRTKLGNNKLLVYNGIRSTPQLQIGDDHQKSTDAVMIEHFGHFNSGTKESMLLDIREMEKAGKSGKIVVFKAWPGFAWIDKEAMKRPLNEKRKIARENIEFPLAAFLAGAQENCYFIYNWGYRMEMGCLEWYPELDKKLGNPLADASQSGWTLTREFEHASVRVNLETKEAKINWKE
ncbi:MAG: putative glycoside hydrolase [Cyclobacteriaceae bacterium]